MRPTLKQRFRYWLDNRMARGTTSMIKVLALATAALILIVAGITVLCFDDTDFGTSLWDSFASTINAWVFYSDDGSIGYVALMAVAAVAGLFITSLLIGILSSGIEEKLNNLRRGNSLVLESGHIVILGFNDAVFRLIGELAIAAENKKKLVIVLVGDTEKEEMEDRLREQLELPRNVRVICRSGDTGNPSSLRCCAIPLCRTVIINEKSDSTSIKAVLAVSALLRSEKHCGVRIVCGVFDEKSALPARIAGEGRIDVLHVDELVSRLIAHSCRQAGISSIITELFSFASDEIYIEPFPKLTGKTFGEAALSFEKTAVIGLLRDGNTLLNPGHDEIVKEGDLFIIIAGDDGISKLLEAPAAPDMSAFAEPDTDKRAGIGNVTVFGYNEKFETMACELARSAENVRLTAVTERDEDRKEIEQIADKLRGSITIDVRVGDMFDRDLLEQLVADATTAIILNAAEKDAEQADADALLLLLQLRDIKKEKGLSLHITTEMQSSANQRLAATDDVSDFIISTDIADLVAVQIAENRALNPVFRNLLSNEGDEIYLCDASHFVKIGVDISTATLIGAAAKLDCVFIGYRKYYPDRLAETVINPSINARVSLCEDDRLIILSKKPL